MNWLTLLLARRSAGNLLGSLAEAAVRNGMSTPGWRSMLSEAAARGDLDGIFEVYVNPAQMRAKKYIDGKIG